MLTMPAAWVTCSRCCREGPLEGPRLDHGAEVCDSCVEEVIAGESGAPLWTARRPRRDGFAGWVAPRRGRVALASLNPLPIHQRVPK